MSFSYCATVVLLFICCSPDLSPACLLSIWLSCTLWPISETLHQCNIHQEMAVVFVVVVKLGWMSKSEKQSCFVFYISHFNSSSVPSRFWLKFHAMAYRNSLQMQLMIFSFMQTHYAFPFPICHASLSFEVQNPFSFSPNLLLLWQLAISFIYGFACSKYIRFQSFWLTGFFLSCTLYFHLKEAQLLGISLLVNKLVKYILVFLASHHIINIMTAVAPSTLFSATCCTLSSLFYRVVEVTILTSCALISGRKSEFLFLLQAATSFFYC